MAPPEVLKVLLFRFGTVSQHGFSDLRSLRGNLRAGSVGLGEPGGKELRPNAGGIFSQPVLLSLGCFSIEPAATAAIKNLAAGECESLFVPFFMQRALPRLI